jgi:oligopeptide/dipeptide ABC transporter ATP-binding protein
MDNILDVKNLYVKFITTKGTVSVLNGCSLSLKQGEVMGLAGESGSGKSVTAMAIINLLRKPGEITGGEVLLEGINILNYSKDKIQQIRGKQIAVIPTNPRAMLHPMIPIGKQMVNAYRSHFPYVTPTEAEQLALQKLEKVQIQDAKLRLSSYPNELSGGMAQRVLIAMALMFNPKIVIADDATAGLDVTVQAQVLDLLKKTVDERKNSCLIITHDLGIIAQYCQSVSILFYGRVIEYCDSVNELFNNALHPYTKTLLSATPGTPREYQKLVMPPGSAMRNIPEKGCLVKERCTRVQPICHELAPKAKFNSKNHWAECHFTEEEKK